MTCGLPGGLAADTAAGDEARCDLRGGQSQAANAATARYGVPHRSCCSLLSRRHADRASGCTRLLSPSGPIRKRCHAAVVPQQLVCANVPDAGSPEKDIR